MGNGKTAIIVVLGLLSLTACIAVLIVSQPPLPPDPDEPPIAGAPSPAGPTDNSVEASGGVESGGGEVASAFDSSDLRTAIRAVSLAEDM